MPVTRGDTTLIEAFGVPIPANSTTVSVSTTTATAALTANSVYVMRSDVDVHINVDKGATTATTSHFKVPADTLFWFGTSQRHDDFSARTASGTGTVYLQLLTGRRKS